MGNANSRKQHIERAEKTGVLAFQNEGLKDIPADVLRLRGNLRNLDLTGNKLKVLPSFIGDFTVLKQMTLDANQLTSLPDELGHLVKLESFSANHNVITSLPSSMAQLGNLRSLSLTHNQLTQFPLILCDLAKLDTLNLTGNKIKTIPDNVERLHVTELNLNENQINHISEAVVNCKNLKVLRLAENCLGLETFSRKLLAESSIQLFAVEGNLFDMKAFAKLDGYDDYMERFTATKKKIY